MSQTRTLIVGIGSPHGDDQAGWLLARELEQVAPARNIAVRTAASPAQLLHWLSGIDRLIVVDACQGLGPPGTYARWQWPTPAIMRAAWSTSHDVSLPAALSLAEKLRRLPAKVIIWGIQGQTAFPLDEVSPRVTDVISQVTHCVMEELRNGKEPKDLSDMSDVRGP
jgi:hydrogenase maturation protease